MLKLFILIALAASCLAAPPESQTSDGHFGQVAPLQRPSPINPDVPSEPKPAEKVTVITDPKEIAKHKREIAGAQPVTQFTPTVQPPIAHHSKESQDSKAHVAVPAVLLHRQKREQKSSKKSSTPARKSSTKRNRKRSPVSIPLPAPARDLPRRRRDVPQSSTPDTVPPLTHHLNNNRPHPEIARVPLTGSAGLNVPHTLQAHLPAPVNSASKTVVKRDIPVPLVPKYQHPEESPKDSETKQDQHKEIKSSNSKESDESAESAENLKHKLPIVTEHTLQQHHRENEPHLEHPLAKHEFHPEHVDAEHKQPKVEETKVDTTNTSPGNGGTSTDHPIIRHHPVPVAELFARPKQ